MPCQTGMVPARVTQPGQLDVFTIQSFPNHLEIEISSEDKAHTIILAAGISDNKVWFDLSPVLWPTKERIPEDGFRKEALGLHEPG
ncbi:hypothetical protein O181_085921 [Austropuccinia psidii MF-1]|uniref:Uncharacterized protein n=1 Tax=Austropuccinia psidii MF-1 TaxID=1389203 RepID=A0A9Q3IK65_9BASI|nr:hypothetical protein [Austropuccinia psidii MF-1]